VAKDGQASDWYPPISGRSPGYFGWLPRGGTVQRKTFLLSPE
jgi:hypothetical protein